MYPYVTFYLNREKRPEERALEAYTKDYFNLFDLSFLENQILSRLRKESIQDVELMYFTELFILYFDMCDRNLIQSAEHWYTSTIQDIEREVNEKVKRGDEYVERSDAEKAALRAKLAKKHFKHKKENI